jgi:hypothetical protein
MFENEHGTVTEVRALGAKKKAIAGPLAMKPC